MAETDFSLVDGRGRKYLTLRDVRTRGRIPCQH
jgi:hypothetical protein